MLDNAPIKPDPFRTAVWAASIFALGAAAWFFILSIAIAASAQPHYLVLETAGILFYAVLFCITLDSWLSHRLQPIPGGLESNRYSIAGEFPAFRVSLSIGSFFAFLVLATNGLQYAFGDTRELVSHMEIAKEFVLIGLATLYTFFQVRHALIAHSSTPDAEAVQWWVPLSAFVLLAIGIGNTGYYLLQKYKNEITHDNQRLLTTISTLKIRQITEWRMHQMNEGESAAGDPLLAQAVSDWFRTGFATGTRREVVARRLESLQRAYGYMAVFLIDAAGEVRLGSDAEAALPEDYGLGMAREAMRQRRVLLSDIHLNPDTTKPVPVIDILVPLFQPAGPAGAVAGVLYIRLDAHRAFNPILRDWPSQLRSGETFLARREGNEIVYLNDLRHRSGSALMFRLPVSGSSLLAAISSEGTKGIIEGVDYRGVPSIGSALDVPDTGWLLVSKTDLGEIFAPINERARAIAIVVFLSVLGAGLAMVLWWRQHRARTEAERYRRELERKTLTRRYEVLMQQASDSIILFNENGLILEANDRASAVYGYSSGELHSRCMEEFCTAESRAFCARKLRAIGEEGILFETIHRKKNGLPFPVEVSARRIGTNGETIGQAIIRDISERKAAELEILQLNARLEARVAARTAELEEANGELRAFSYSLSHDLRAPLRHMIGFSRILQEDCGELLDDACRGHLDRILAAGERMDHLVEGMLKLFRIGTQSQIEFRQVDMSGMAREILAQLAMNHPGRNVTSDVAESVTASGDPALLRDILENLLGNAWKYTSKQNKARIEFGLHRPVGGQQAYFVRDNGAGFDMEFAAKLFRPFERLHRDSDFPGTGVGLATVQRIIRRHGGRIWGEGRAGEGATFHFTLGEDALPAGNDPVERFTDGSSD